MTASDLETIPVDVLLKAYTRGVFPMAHDDGELYWHEPDPRAVFNLASIQPDPTTARVMRSGRYAITRDLKFEAVMRACAVRDETWIDERIIGSYVALHATGHAHSVEVREGEKLIGGIYGVALGGAFFGESMFGVNNAGKVAFYSLVKHIQQQGFVLFDSQYINPFTKRLGAIEIPKADFMQRLDHALSLTAHF
ncbi:MAG: leucyl/phenylalanyl-tRNA--protein transferase [Flavobacteriales bacterium]|nr:leucyl/phenylalanyl-tRNA--protein transferase [Flavobacteriales bacterium]MCC6936729.1 leucyl/phenylalanyl-tRNA--protein transferase [Flavobacteriales bacterium]